MRKNVEDGDDRSGHRIDLGKRLRVIFVSLPGSAPWTESDLAGSELEDADLQSAFPDTFRQAVKAD
jgi:hypothetical protein